MKSRGMLYMLAAISVVVLLLLAAGAFLSDFFAALKYINCEIKRAEGDERIFWIRKRRKLWLSLLPFIKP